MVLNNFEDVQDFPLSGQGSIRTSISNVDAEGDDDLQVTVPGSTDGFRLLLQNGFGSKARMIDTLLTAESLTLDATADDDDIIQSFDLSIRSKTDALGGVAQADASGRLTIVNAEDNEVQIVAELGSGTVRSALQAFRDGDGSFFKIAVANVGFPAIKSQQVFAVDTLQTVIPEPASLALGLKRLESIARRRRCFSILSASGLRGSAAAFSLA